jgi:hypothetical protein
VGASERFDQLRRHIRMLDENRRRTRVSLNLEENLRQQQNLDRLTDDFLEKETEGLEIRPVSIPENGGDEKMEKIQADRRKQFFSDIKQDLYIEEALFILKDWFSIPGKIDEKN